MRTGPILRGARVTLRPPQPGDQEDRLRVGAVPEHIRMCGGDPADAQPYTPAAAADWYERVRQTPHGWIVEAEGRCVGTARLHSLDAANRRARYAVGLFDPTVWGGGYGVEVTRLVLRYAFETLALHRVDLRVIAYNQRAIACYAKCGFVREGVERQGALIAGQWHSDVMMSILEQEYRAMCETW